MNKKLNLKILILFSLSLIAFSLINIKLGSHQTEMIFTGMVSLGLMSLPLILKKLDKHSSIIVPSGILIFLFIFTIIDGFSILIMLAFFLPIFVSMLFNNPKAPLVISVSSSIYLLILHILFYDKVFNNELYHFISITHIITFIITIIVAGIIAYFQCKKNIEILSSIKNNSKIIEENNTKNLHIISSLENTSNTVAISIHDLNKVSDELVCMSEEISTFVTNISSNLNSESQSIEKTQVFFNSLESSFHDMIISFGKVKDSVGETKYICESNNSSMKNMSDKMNDLATLSKELFSFMNDIYEHNKKIKKIVEMINTISNKTNMLSLNASIEASRAGEAGKGFAVVAHEVKTLSLQTEEYANKINNYLEIIESSIQKSKEASEKCVTEITEGVKYAEKAKSSFIEISQSINTIDDSSEYLNSKCISLNKELKFLSKDLKGIWKINNQSNEYIINIVNLTDNQSKNVYTVKDSLSNIVENIEHLKNTLE